MTNTKTFNAGFLQASFSDLTQCCTEPFHCEYQARIRGGAPGARPPVRPYMLYQNINLRSPVWSDILYCWRPLDQYFLDPRLNIYIRWKRRTTPKRDRGRHRWAQSSTWTNRIPRCGWHNKFRANHRCLWACSLP